MTLSGVVGRQQIHRRGRFRLRVLAETEDGRKLTLDRTLRRCPEHPPQVVVLEAPLRVEAVAESPRSGPTPGSAARSVAADW